MPDEPEKNKFTRRGFLGVGSAALAAAGVNNIRRSTRMLKAIGEFRSAARLIARAVRIFVQLSGYGLTQNGKSLNRRRGTPKAVFCSTMPRFANAGACSFARVCGYPLPARETM